MKTTLHPSSAFTLVETLIATGVIAILGGVVFTLMNASTMLYAQNVSLNRTLSDGVFSTEKLLVKLAPAAEVPVLVNDAGADVTGNGPAAGVRFFSLASTQAYPIPAAVTATATSFAITKTAAQSAPLVGYKVTMADVGFSGVITSVSGSGSNYTIRFASAVGGGFIPAKTTGTVIPANSRCFLLAPSAFISVNGVLREYSRARSVAADGAAAFNNPANFVPVATLLPVSGQTNCFPFQYLDAGRRAIDVNLRLRSAAHGGRIREFYTFENLTTTVAYRSSPTQ